MPTKTKTLPPVRVSEGLHAAVKTVAGAQEVSVAEVIRLALVDYCVPRPRPVVPIVGELSADTNWDTITIEAERLKKEFQDYLITPVLAGEGE